MQITGKIDLFFFAFMILPIDAFQTRRIWHICHLLRNYINAQKITIFRRDSVIKLLFWRSLNLQSVKLEILNHLITKQMKHLSKSN